MLKRAFGYIATASEKRPWLVLAAVAAVTAFMAAGIPGIKTELSQESMMPRGYESIVTYQDIEKIFGGVSYENALVIADDVTATPVASALLNLTPEALVEKGLDEGWVTGVETYMEGFRRGAELQGQPLPPASLLGYALGLYLDTPYFQEQVLGRTVSEDLTATLVKFQLDPDLSQGDSVKLATGLAGILEEDFGSQGEGFYLSGMASTQKDQLEMMGKETRFLFLAALLFIMLILYLTFRRVSDIFLPLLTIVLAIVWLLGFMGWSGIPYTTMSVAIIPLMLGINIAYVIHILNRYYEEREAGSNVFSSATGSITTVGVAVFLTALTTIIGFASFTISDMPPMKDFGIICMLGIAFSFLLSLTMLPGIIVIRDRRKKTEKLDEHLEKMRRRRRKARYGQWVDRLLVASSTSAYHHHWIVLGLMVVLICLSLFAGFGLRVGADIRTMFSEEMPSRKAGEVISSYFGSQNFDMVLLEGDIYQPESITAILEMSDRMSGDERNRSIGRGSLEDAGMISVAHMVADASDGTVPDTREEIEAIIEGVRVQAGLDTLVNRDGSAALLMVGSDMSDTEKESSLKATIMREAASSSTEGTGLSARATGLSILITDLMGNMLPTQLQTSGLALLLCLLVLIIVFRSFLYGLATLMVVVTGIAIEMIMLYLLNWPLDFMTVTVSALVIGVGVDFGIHITHRFREQIHEKKTSLEEAIRSTVLHVGRSLIAAAFTTAGVFAILGISSMVPLRRFGWTVAVGLIASLLGAIIVLPSLLALISRRRHEVLNNDSQAVSGTDPGGPGPG